MKRSFFIDDLSAFGPLFGSRWKCNFFNCLNKEVENFAFVKGAKKNTEKLRFLQVAKGRVVQKYISILEENTAGWDIKEYQYLSLDLGEKHDQEYSKLVLHIYHIFSYAVPNAFIFLYVILNL